MKDFSYNYNLIATNGWEEEMIVNILRDMLNKTKPTYLIRMHKNVVRG